MRRYHLITVVWGDVYLDLFTSIVLPSQQTEGNLHGLARRANATYKVYTVPGDVPRLEEALSDLRRHMPVEVVPVVALETKNHHLAISRCHRLASQAAAREGAALVFLTPDAIWTEGSFTGIVDLQEQGKRVILMPGIRVEKESFLPGYRRALAERGGESLPPRELIRLAMPTLHPISRSVCWDSTHFSTHPSHLYWRVGERGLLAHCFHLHPLLIDAGGRGLDFKGTIDDDFVHRVAPDTSEVHVVEDSDQMAVLEISRADFCIGIPTRERRPTPLGVAYWASVQANQQHCSYFRRPLRIHSDGGDSAEWAAAARQADEVVNRINFYLGETGRTLRGVRTTLWLGGRTWYYSLRAVSISTCFTRAVISSGVVAAKQALGIEGDLLANAPKQSEGS
ncbi:MAG: hypothetical protein AB7U23_15825 [Dehalococcoidia bacterium]